jgi:hypothetical protein
MAMIIKRNQKTRRRKKTDEESKKKKKKDEEPKVDEDKKTTTTIKGEEPKCKPTCDDTTNPPPPTNKPPKEEPTSEKTESRNGITLHHPKCFAEGKPCKGRDLKDADRETCVDDANPTKEAACLKNVDCFWDADECPDRPTKVIHKTKSITVSEKDKPIKTSDGSKKYTYTYGLTSRSELSSFLIVLNLRVTELYRRRRW